MQSQAAPLGGGTGLVLPPKVWSTASNVGSSGAVGASYIARAVITEHAPTLVRAPPRAQMTAAGPSIPSAGYTLSNAAGNTSSPSLGSLTNKMAGLQITTLPKRPDYGKKGKTVRLVANYFQADVDKSRGVGSLPLYVYTYSFKLKGNAKKLPLSRRMVRLAHKTLLNDLREKTGANIASDFQQTIVSRFCFDLSELDTRFFIHDENEKTTRKEVRYALKEHMSVNTHDILHDLRTADPTKQEEIIKMLNVIFNQQAHNSQNLDSFSSARGSGNRFFETTIAEDRTDLGKGLWAVAGYFSSMRKANAGLLLNVNVCFGAYLKPGPAKDFVAILKAANADVDGSLKGIRIKTSHRTNKDNTVLIETRPAIGMGKPISSIIERTKDEGGPITIQKYFDEKYGLVIRDKRTIAFASHAGDIHIPIELCEVANNQRFQSGLDRDQSAKLLQESSVLPNRAVDLIKRGHEHMQFKNKEWLKKFGLKIEAELVKVKGRILDVPTIQFGDEKEGSSNTSSAVQEPGSWSFERNKFLETPIGDVNVACLAILDGSDLSRPRTVYNAFLQQVNSNGLQLRDIYGGQLQAMDYITSDNIEVRIKDQLRLFKSADIKVLIVMMGRHAQRHLYTAIKRIGDCEIGIHTSCVVFSNISNICKPNNRKGWELFANNMALKINLKLGCAAHSLGGAQQLKIFKDKRTMLVGIDVTHPSPCSVKGSPSIAGIVATIDDSFVKYSSGIQIQKVPEDKESKEMVTDIRGMFAEQLAYWKDRNSSLLPEQIFIYRDGVGESQYKAVLEEEYSQIHLAIRDLYPDAASRPKVVIIVVGKRHHTRFYPEEKVPDTEGDATVQNCQPGTVVDKTVTSEQLWDFYLQPHQGLKGTVRPAHYVVIKNDIANLTSDSLQGATHALSYLFGCAPRAVAICPPALYADRLCDRARMYLSSMMNGADNSAQFKDMTKDQLYLEALRLFGTGVHDDIKRNMYFI